MSEDSFAENPEIKKQLEIAQQSILERLTQAGWIQSARNEKGVLIEWTESGIEAAKQFGMLFDKLGHDIGALELAALINILENMSPGGSESEDSRI